MRKKMSFLIILNRFFFLSRYKDRASFRLDVLQKQLADSVPSGRLVSNTVSVSNFKSICGFVTTF